MNIVLTQGAKFRPYSFEEQLKPFLMADKEYRAIEEGLNELSTRSKLYERMANEDPNSQVGKMYKAFSDELSSQVDLLARDGLTPASRSALLDMKSRYSENIAPIEDAYKRYGESNKYRQSIKAKDNTAMFLNRPTIDDFLNGNTPDETYISGKDLMSRAATEAEITATTVFQEQLAKGKTRTEALEAVRAMEDERLRGIVNRELAGIEGFDNLSQLEQAQLTDYINKGVYAGMGNLAKGEYQTRQQEEQLELSRNSQALQREQHSRLQAKAELEANLNGFKYNPKTGKYIQMTEDEYSKVLGRKGATTSSVGDKNVININDPSNPSKIITLTKKGSIWTGTDSSGNPINMTPKQVSEIPVLGDTSDIMLDYSGDSFDSGEGDFNPDNAVIVPPSSLSESSREKLLLDLESAGKTIKDVVIYLDDRYKNAYRVVRKGYSPSGRLQNFNPNGGV